MTRCPYGFTKNELIASWALAIVAAGALTVLGWLPKLTGDVYAQALFNVVASSDLVPLQADVLRFVVGATELAVVLLLLIPATRVYGGLLAVFTMLGALTSHLITPLGIAGTMLLGGQPQVIGGETIPGTNPILFPLGVVILLLGAAVTAIHRRQLPIIGAAAQPTAATG
ncbi:MAG: hypothetical protein AAGI30_12620 [Planctomycetota bacterium]